MSQTTKTLPLTVTGGAEAGVHNLQITAYDQAGSSEVWDGDEAILPHEFITRPSNAGWATAGFTNYTIGAVGDYTDYDDFRTSDPGGNVILNHTAGVAGRVTKAITFAGRSGSKTVIQPSGYTESQGTRIRAVTDDASMGRILADAGNYTVTVQHTTQDIWVRGMMFENFVPNGSVGAHIYASGPGSSQIADGLYFDRCMFRGSGTPGTQGTAYGFLAWVSNWGCWDSVFDGFTTNVTNSGAMQLNGGKVIHIENNFLQSAGVTLRVGFSSPALPILQPQHVITRGNHIYKANALWDFHKGGWEAKNGFFILADGNFVERGVINTFNGDPTNVIAFGVKAAGGNTYNPLPSLTSCTISQNIVKGYPRVGYIQNKGGSAVVNAGAAFVTFHDNLCYDLGSGSDAWGLISGSENVYTWLWYLAPSTSASGVVGPHRCAFHGNTLVVPDSAPVQVNRILGATSDWTGDNGPPSSYVDDNIFPRSQFGWHNQSGVAHPGTGVGGWWEGIASMDYNVVPPAESEIEANWNSTTWHGPSNINQYLDADYRLTAAGVTQLRVDRGIGGGAAIASGRTYRKYDNTTGTRTTPGADITDLESVFTDVNAPSVASAPGDIRYP
jgi:hypothetical protein